MRERVGDAIGRAPGIDASSGELKFDWGLGVGKGTSSDGRFDNRDGGSRGLVDFESVVPGFGWEDLPVCAEAALAKFDPTFTGAVREDERAALDGDRIFEPARDARLHGEIEFDDIAGLPFAIEARKGSRLHRNACRLAIDADLGTCGPLRNAKRDWEVRWLRRIDRDFDEAAKGIAGFFGEADVGIAHVGGDFAGSVDCGDEAVVR